MNIKQSAAVSAILIAIVLTGAGCLGRQSAPAPLPTPVPQAVDPTAVAEQKAVVPTETVPSDWIRYDKDAAGQIGMSFFYPPELVPVRWDTEAWGPDAVGVDFGGFGVARIPNAERLTAEEWVSRKYAGFTFSMTSVGSDDPFFPAIPNGACDAMVVNDDFRNDAGMSGIGGTVFLSVGDASLYVFSLGQDWNQELGEREAVIRTIMDSAEWFAEQTTCPETVTVRDDRVKIAFSVPRNLALVVTSDEFGWGTEETEYTTDFTCLEQRAYESVGDESPTTFLVVNDTWQCQTLGRGGYWGDHAGTFSTEADVKKWCETKDSCVPYVNPNGVTIYHAYSKSVDFFGETLSDIDEYGAWNPNQDIHGILISNQGFVQDGLGRMQDELIVVADSLSFME